jgi:hypothetical protein
MSTNVATLPGAGQELAEIMDEVLGVGDLSQLPADVRTRYYLATCSSLGLNPYTRPLEYVKLSGKTVLYARKDAADQLRRIHGVSLEVTDRKVTGEMMFVTVRASLPDGRHDEDVGAVSIKGLQGEALANATMKCITKAKRRATLSLCGLGLPDESEVESVQSLTPPDAKAIAHQPAPAPAAPTKPTITVMDSGVPIQFAKSMPGLAAALDHIAAAGATAVMDNFGLLDDIATVTAFADRVADIRARAALELAPPEAWPGQYAGAEPPEPDQDTQDSTSAAMAVLRGDRPAGMTEAEASNLPE